MKRQWISITGLIILLPYAEGCSRWVVAEYPLDRKVESEQGLRVKTNSSLVELRNPKVSPEFLYGNIVKVNGKKPTAPNEDSRSPKLISPPNELPSPKVEWSIAVGDIQTLYLYHVDRGWVKTDRALEDLVSSQDRIRLRDNRGTYAELSHCHVSPDSLYGQYEDKSLNKRWIAIPRNEIQQVSVNRTNIPATLGLAIGIPLVSFFALALLACGIESCSVN